MNTFVPPRGPDGKILLSDVPIVTEQPEQQQDMPQRTLADLLPSHERTAPPAMPRRTTRSQVVYWSAVVGTLALVVVAVVSVLRAGSAASPAGSLGGPVTNALATQPAATAPHATPVPTPQPVLPAGLAVYFGPDGDAAPSVPAGTTEYTPTARYAGWLQLDIQGYAQRVWARADALPWIQADGLPAPYQATPTPRPAVIVQQAPTPPPQMVLCTLDNATYRATRSNIKGSATAPSCTSQAEAEANAEALLIQQTGEGSK